MLEKLYQLDRDILIFLNNIGDDRFDPFWRVITSIYTWIPLYGLIIFLFFRAYHRPKAQHSVLLSFFSVIVVNVLVIITKEAITRARPLNNPDLEGILRAVYTANDYSFFSGHASNSFAITTFAVLCLRFKYKWIYLIYAWPVLFSFSRMYLGAHYPSDIFVGTVVGLIIGYVFYQIHKKT
ncbi:phosphatase PAP2 family protein [Abyssalbus ytuae]|uniref:Phosphatase PAP2 family protein n=1 Tax=Abyssalbus ytuae TaxID=2926907 RepID=A0A9E7A034_9FLAO|nr:phosphatase PAP2 family protein [Abyssalbus ytuae]UOB18337.1 phosphatase PAP2 family protein [Abyssalbus ytuae]